MRRRERCYRINFIGLAAFKKRGQFIFGRNGTLLFRAFTQKLNQKPNGNASERMTDKVYFMFCIPLRYDGLIVCSAVSCVIMLCRMRRTVIHCTAGKLGIKFTRPVPCTGYCAYTGSNAGISFFLQFRKKIARHHSPVREILVRAVIRAPSAQTVYKDKSVALFIRIGSKRMHRHRTDK